MSEESKPTGISFVDSARKNSRNPKSLTFHVVFKALALLLWIFSLPPNDTMRFAVIVTVVLMDFWTVKNVTGRRLVGLRYWNKINDDGSSEWVYESATDVSNISASDSRIFWTVLVSYPIVWFGVAFLMILLPIFKKSSMDNVLVIIGIVSGTTNLVGYVKCRKDAKRKITGFLAQQAFAHASRV
ncbi:hypothetical protein RCL1_001362 [Eukaryota sp. TZLM3-RCL]